MIHSEKSPFAGRTIRIKKDATHFQYPSWGGSEIKIEDWQDRVIGKSWKEGQNIACVVYAQRVLMNPAIPDDDEVLYGHRKDGLGSLIHISELEV